MGTAAKTLLTIEQFAELPEVEGISYELDEGELIEVPRRILLHNLVRDKTAARLANHFHAKDQGRVVAIQAFRLGRDTVRIPDVAFIASGQPIDLNSFIQQFGPALAVEITSPSNTFSELARKTRQYLDAGSQAVWILVPPSREIHVYSANAHPRILCGDDVLEDPALLPGFSVRASDLFRV